jgi:hypothetical protein
VLIIVIDMFRDLVEAFKKKFLCCHEWEQVKKSELYWSGTDKYPTWVEITFLCKKCGKFKKIRV